MEIKSDFAPDINEEDLSCVIGDGKKYISYKGLLPDKLSDFLNDDKYINFFKIKQIMNVVLNADMINTVNCYLKNAMNTSVACMAGYMHRNTMIYRIQKIKNVVGLDIRLFDEAVLFNNMLICSKLLNK